MSDNPTPYGTPTIQLSSALMIHGPELVHCSGRLLEQHIHSCRPSETTIAMLRATLEQLRLAMERFDIAQSSGAGR